MTLVVGHAPRRNDRSAISLAAMTARALATDLLVVSVVPAPWPTLVVGSSSGGALARVFLGSNATRVVRHSPVPVVVVPA